MTQGSPHRIFRDAKRIELILRGLLGVAYVQVMPSNFGKGEFDYSFRIQIEREPPFHLGTHCKDGDDEALLDGARDIMDVVNLVLMRRGVPSVLYWNPRPDNPDGSSRT